MVSGRKAAEASDGCGAKRVEALTWASRRGFWCRAVRGALWRRSPTSSPWTKPRVRVKWAREIGLEAAPPMSASGPGAQVLVLLVAGASGLWPLAVGLEDVFEASVEQVLLVLGDRKDRPATLGRRFDAQGAPLHEVAVGPEGAVVAAGGVAELVDLKVAARLDVSRHGCVRPSLAPGETRGTGRTRPRGREGRGRSLVITDWYAVLMMDGRSLKLPSIMRQKIKSKGQVQVHSISRSSTSKLQLGGVLESCSQLVLLLGTRACELEAAAVATLPWVETEVIRHAQLWLHRAQIDTNDLCCCRSP